MIIQGVSLNGVTVVDNSPVTNNLVLYYDPSNIASYPGSGSTTQISQNTAYKKVKNR